MKCGSSNNWKAVDRPSFQNFGKLMKPFGNKSFPISFQMFNVIGNPNIFCSESLNFSQEIELNPRKESCSSDERSSLQTLTELLAG